MRSAASVDSFHAPRRVTHHAPWRTARTVLSVAPLGSIRRRTDAIQVNETFVREFRRDRHGIGCDVDLVRMSRIREGRGFADVLCEPWRVLRDPESSVGHEGSSGDSPRRLVAVDEIEYVLPVRSRDLAHRQTLPLGLLDDRQLKADRLDADDGKLPSGMKADEPRHDVRPFHPRTHEIDEREARAATREENRPCGEDRIGRVRLHPALEPAEVFFAHRHIDGAEPEMRPHVVLGLAIHDAEPAVIKDIVMPDPRALDDAAFEGSGTLLKLPGSTVWSQPHFKVLARGLRVECRIQDLVFRRPWIG